MNQREHRALADCAVPSTFVLLTVRPCETISSQHSHSLGRPRAYTIDQREHRAPADCAVTSTIVPPTELVYRRSEGWTVMGGAARSFGPSPLPPLSYAGWGQSRLEQPRRG